MLTSSSRICSTRSSFLALDRLCGSFRSALVISASFTCICTGNIKHHLQSCCRAGRLSIFARSSQVLGILRLYITRCAAVCCVLNLGLAKCSTHRCTGKQHIALPDHCGLVPEFLGVHNLAIHQELSLQLPSRHVARQDFQLHDHQSEHQASKTFPVSRIADWGLLTTCARLHSANPDTLILMPSFCSI